MRESHLRAIYHWGSPGTCACEIGGQKTFLDENSIAAYSEEPISSDVTNLRQAWCHILQKAFLIGNLVYELLSVHDDHLATYEAPLALHNNNMWSDRSKRTSDIELVYFTVLLRHEAVRAHWEIHVEGTDISEERDRRRLRYRCSHDVDRF